MTDRIRHGIDADFAAGSEWTGLLRQDGYQSATQRAIDPRLARNLSIRYVVKIFTKRKRAVRRALAAFYCL
jgi:hypothetical protein